MDSDDDPIERGLRIGETAIYLGISVLLAVVSVLLLGYAGYELVDNLDDGVDVAAADTLDALLLTFIFVELLSAVRTTIRRRGLVAEPFLLVGIIASIKEIVLIAGTEEPHGDAFRESMIKLGVLGGLVLVLALAAYLLRVKEREPEETET